MAVARRKSPAKSKAPRRGERVRHILGESLKLFAEQGYERATYDDLIRRARVSRGSFYWYFPSKEALYGAVLDFCVSGYVARLEDAFARTDTKAPVVKRLLDAALADFNANRATYRLLLYPPPSASAVARLAQWNEDAQRFMAEKLKPAVAAGALDAEAAAVLPDVLGAFLDGLCVRLVLDDEGSVSTLSRNVEAFLLRITAKPRKA